MALKRARQPVNVQKIDGGGYYSALLELFNGKTTPDAVLTQIHRNEDGQLDDDLANAYFYIGEYHALSGDNIRAKVLLERSLSKSPLPTTNSIAAQHELQRLK